MPTPQEDLFAAKPDAKPAAKTTPMMEQYLRIKQQHSGALLFYRMGDFYELFFDDAVTAAAALDIALTKRGKHSGADIPMCGVPVHSAETYLSRLIRKGFRVVVCEQTGEPPKQRGAKSVMNRKVERVITPGTLTEDTLLDARSHNFLVALAYDGAQQCGLAWADVSTGLFCTRLLPADELAMELARLAPGELLVPESALALDAVKTLEAENPGALTPLHERDFDARTGAQRLLRLLGIVSLEPVGDYQPLELAACGALVGYVESTQVGRLPSLEAPRRQTRQSVMAIDPATRRNLELTQSISGERKHSLLGTIDRTVTAPGARLLKEWLAAPLLDPDAINHRLDAVDCLRAVAGLRARLRDLLRQTPDMARALGRLSLERGGPRDLGALRDGLRGAHRLRERLDETAADAGLPDALRQAAADIGSDGADLEQHLRRALVAEPPPSLKDGGMVAHGYAAALDDTRQMRDDSRKIVAAMQKRYARETGIANLKIRHNNILGYHIDVSATHADRLMQEPLKHTYIHRQTMASNVRFTTSELSELDARIQHAKDNAIEQEQQIFNQLREQALDMSAPLKRIAAAVARLDVLLAFGERADSDGHVRPQVDSSLVFDIRGGRHPVVEAALGDTPFVANDCALNLPAQDAENGNGGNGADEAETAGLQAPDKRVWLLTGPNMAGKSTFLRQNALIAILAQLGCFVPAQSARIGAVDRIFSRVGAADDLARGRSTFLAEMLETAAILHQATPRSLVILDEIGRGTATFDGLAIAWAVLEHLHNSNQCRALFATHYHELAALQATLPALAAVHMRARQWRDDIVFLHEVAPGTADASYGLQVAKLAGIPAAVVARAQERLDHFEAARPKSGVP